MVRLAAGGSVGPERKRKAKGQKKQPRKRKLWTWEEAFRLCCGNIGLTPERFYALTYAELCLLLEGHREKQKAARRDMAWCVAHLLRPHLKEGAELTPEMLLGEGPKRAVRTNAEITANEAATVLFASRRII